MLEHSQVLLYFYSTIVQSMAALFAVYGIFGVYGFQTADNEINNTKNAFAEFASFYRSRIHSYGGHSDARMWLGKDFIDHLDFLIDKEKGTRDKVLLKAYTDYRTHIQNLETYKNNVWNGIIRSIVLVSINFVSAMFVLSFLDGLFKFSIIIIGWHLVATLFLSVLIVIDIGWGIYQVARGPARVYINNPRTNIPGRG